MLLYTKHTSRTTVWFLPLTMMYRHNCFCKQAFILTVLCATLLKAQRPVCPQQGATTITQLELVPRPKGIVKLRCDFNVPPDPTHSETGFLYIAWVIDTTRHLYSHLYDPIHNDDGEIQPGYEDFVINVTDNFNNLGRAQGSSTIMLNVDLTTKNELKCEILLNNHQYCVDTTRIQFQEPDITLESDGVVHCQNNGGVCRQTPSKDCDITCRVKHSESNPPTMAIMVNYEIVSNGSAVIATTNSDRYYDGVITAFYHIPENAYCTCTVTDTRGTYHLTSKAEFEAHTSTSLESWGIAVIIIIAMIILSVGLLFGVRHFTKKKRVSEYIAIPHSCGFSCIQS